MNGGKFLSSVLLGTFATVITSSTTTSAVSITKERLNRIKEMVPNADIKEINIRLKSVSNINEKLDKIFNREDAKDILECLFGNEDFIDSSLKRIFSSRVGKNEYVFDKIIERADALDLLKLIHLSWDAKGITTELFSSKTGDGEFVFKKIMTKDDALNIVKTLCNSKSPSLNMNSLFNAKIGEKFLIDEVLARDDASNVIHALISSEFIEIDNIPFNAKTKENTFVFENILRRDDASKIIKSLLSHKFSKEKMKTLFEEKIGQDFIIVILCLTQRQKKASLYLMKF